MTVLADVLALQRQLAAVPAEERLGYFKGWLANLPDPETRAAMTAMWGMLHAFSPAALGAHTASPRQVVLLLHGIRTEGVWQGVVAGILGALPNVTVYPVGYGWYDAFRFWSPAWMRLRAAPELAVVREIRDIKERHPGEPITVIAHSFGTYLVSRILSDNTDIKFARLLLCGSIVPRDYAWPRVQTGPGGMLVVNDVGSRDLWPVAARVASWGYGCSGTMGFYSTRVTNRFFDYSHSDFLTREHARTYWAPFVAEGTVVPSKWDVRRPEQSWLVSVLGNAPMVKLVIGGVLGLLGIVILSVV